MSNNDWNVPREAALGERAESRRSHVFRLIGQPLKSEAGSAMVEFALVILLLMTMFFGIMDFGRALYSYHFVSHAARDATRWAAVNGADCPKDNSCDGAGYMNNGTADQTAIQTYVNSITPLGIDSSQVTTTASWPGNGTTACPSLSKNPGCPVQVQVSYKLNFMFSLVHSASITLSSSSQMTIAH